MPLVRLGEAAGSLSGADPRLMALAVVLFAACQSVSGLQWWVCQRAGGIRGLGAAHTLGLHWLARAACEALPASLGEGVRVALVRRHPHGAEAGTWRVVGALGSYKIVDAVVGAAAVLAIFMLTPPPGPAGDVRWMALAALGVAAVVLVIARRGRGSARLRDRLPARVGQAFARMAEGTRGLADPTAVRMAGLLSVVAMLLRVMSLSALLAALGLPAEAGAMVYALIVVSGLLPLAPGGAGTREAVLVPTLALAYGVPASSALALSVAIQVIALGTTLALGALAFAWLGPVLAGRRTLSESVDLVADAPLVTVSVGTTTGQ